LIPYRNALGSHQDPRKTSELEMQSLAMGAAVPVKIRRAGGADSQGEGEGIHGGYLVFDLRPKLERRSGLWRFSSMPSGGGRKELHSGETGAQCGRGVVRVGLGDDGEGPTKVGRYWKGA
jgi:hypothetical protein